MTTEPLHYCGCLKRNENDIFTWVISRDFLLSLTKGIVVSPMINMSNDDDKKFRLELHKCQSLDRSLQPNIIRESIRLFLCYLKENSSLMCKYSISVIMDGEIIDARTDYCTFSTNCSEALIFNMPSMKIDQEIIYSYDVHIRCKLTFATENIEPFLKYDLAQTVPKYNFDCIFLNKDLSDVTLRTASEKEIPAHKIMLATASPVFKAMFNHDMLEKQSQIIDMIDVSYEAAVEMLRYIYTGDVGNDENSLTTELLAVSDKYQLDDLKYRCEKILSFQLSSYVNAVEMLKISDTYRGKYLKKKSVDFIRSILNGPLLNYEEISNKILSIAQIVSK
ncbi:kelch-like protein 13 [Trichogramma pretiosum]|uniref:kelch-like protein 13 n=1 Tax=Trichogramma pretiosum TaxID=7493 RepID=UPI0006C995A0|nr:kelch-like protein 13 [Trichogramma pretiosum]